MKNTAYYLFLLALFGLAGTADYESAKKEDCARKCARECDGYYDPCIEDCIEGCLEEN